MSTNKVDEILECCLPYIQNPKDRSSISTVCRRWCELDGLTRRGITIYLCYSTTPQRLYSRFPNIESLKIKGNPRASMFGLLPEDWGGYATPWVASLRGFTRLSSIHFRRMIVKDDDLKTIASVKGCSLVLLKLDKCSGFSTDGLLHVTRSCTNLRTLLMHHSKVDDKNGEWLHQLALNNKVLEVLNFYMTFMEHIKVEDLELLARNCPLVSVKIGDTDIFCLVNFFRSATRLQEFCGASFDGNLDHNSGDFRLPAQLTSLGPLFLMNTHLPILYPVANSLLRLDLSYGLLTCDGHCFLLQRCHNLLVLETSDEIGDEGLEVLSLTCKRLKRLRIEGLNDVPPNEVGGESGGITQTGLIAVARGCPDLEYLSVNVVDIGNEALECIGAHLNNLSDFRLVLLNRRKIITDLPLDNGVRALLQGCPKIQRLAIYLREGGMTDVGLSYIGQLGQNVRWMLLGFVGETDAGFVEFSKGCCSLQRLEMRGCCFTPQALGIAVKQLASLRFMWVQAFQTSQMVAEDWQEMARPYWHVELIFGDEYNVRGNFLAYYSLAGQRTDYPNSVFPLATATQ